MVTRTTSESASYATSSATALSGRRNFTENRSIVAMRHIAIVSRKIACASLLAVGRSRRWNLAGNIRDSISDACTLRPCTFQFGRRDDVFMLERNGPSSRIEAVRTLSLWVYTFCLSKAASLCTEAARRRLGMRKAATHFFTSWISCIEA